MSYIKKKLQGLVWDDNFTNSSQNQIWKDIKSELRNYNIDLAGFATKPKFKLEIIDNPGKFDFLMIDVINTDSNDTEFGHKLALEIRGQNFQGPIFMISQDSAYLYDSNISLAQPFFAFHKSSDYRDISFNIYNYLSVLGLTQSKIFIGHGRANHWELLRNLLEKKFKIECEEFNSIATAGFQTGFRLQTMMKNAGLAMIVMSAEDELNSTDWVARQNVVHEIGLFQGHLGMEKVIMFREEGCSLFSNIQGITYVSYSKGNISSCFDRIQPILEREKFILR